ncbi:hypothetical protein [Leifsonia xyli]|uniref:hypothetical protein n=1 Tax=Leifsonia xyli TaxID=1575 RepID=UPI003D6757BE
MPDETTDYFPGTKYVFLDRLSVQSGAAPRGWFLERYREDPAWNRPWTAEDKRRVTGVPFAPVVEAFLERDEYDTAIHDRLEASFLANLNAAHERLDLLIDVFKICFPTAAFVELIRNYDNDSLEIERVVGPRNRTLSTGQADGLRPHRYTIQDLIDQLGPEPAYLLGERVIETEPDGERRRFRLPIK